jgi:hypothetical protein
MKGYNFEFTMSKSFPNAEVEIFIQVKDFTPERPAPACSNPSSPAYSDCGDSAEFGDYFVHMMIMTEQGKIFFIPLPDDLFALLEEEIIEEIFKKGEENHQAELSERWERIEMETDNYDL